MFNKGAVQAFDSTARARVDRMASSEATETAPKLPFEGSTESNRVSSPRRQEGYNVDPRARHHSPKNKSSWGLTGAKRKGDGLRIGSPRPSAPSEGLPNDTTLARLEPCQAIEGCCQTTSSTVALTWADRIQRRQWPQPQCSPLLTPAWPSS